jgi:hypothetical protein
VKVCPLNLDRVFLPTSNIHTHPSQTSMSLRVRGRFVFLNLYFLVSLLARARVLYSEVVGVASRHGSAESSH